MLPFLSFFTRSKEKNVNVNVKKFTAPHLVENTLNPQHCKSPLSKDIFYR